MPDQVVVDILLLSSTVDWNQKGHQLTMVHLLEEDPSSRYMMFVAKELPAIVLITATGRPIVQVVVLVLGALLLSIITGFTGSTRTGSINMPTVKEAKIPELNCPQREQTCFLITLLTSGMTVSASIRTAMELDVIRWKRLWEWYRQ